jgi:hypothetical protein
MILTNQYKRCSNLLVDDDIDAAVNTDGFVRLGIQFGLWCSHIELQRRCTSCFQEGDLGFVASCRNDFVASLEDVLDELGSETGG